jgi:hypothetical protein
MRSPRLNRQVAESCLQGVANSEAGRFGRGVRSVEREVERTRLA